MHCLFGKITGIWYSLECKTVVYEVFSLRKSTSIDHFRPKIVKMNPKNRANADFSDQIYVLNPENRPTQAKTDHYW